MARIKAFAALRPKPGLAASICELPYDVMSSTEAREMAAGNPLSFLRVSKPEIELPPDVDVHSEKVYSHGAQNLKKMIADGVLCQDPLPAYYIYRQIMGSHSQTGLVAVASCEDYLRGVIRKHELTRPDKEDDRVRHIEVLDSQTGPVFLTYRADKALDALFRQQCTGMPDIDFTARDGVRHTAWVIAEPRVMDEISAAFARIPFLYIADGHHRSAAAARVYQKRKGSGESGWFLSVIFPHDQMQILPYNRALKDLNGLSPEALLARLRPFIGSENGVAMPQQKREISFYFQRKWRTLFLPPKESRADGAENLDVSRLQTEILAPIFGIEDPRTSERISFIGGIRGTGELEKRVDAGEFACAFSMFPTSIEDLMTIADAGGIMPPKSTWFEPKLRDAMFCHMIA